MEARLDLSDRRLHHTPRLHLELFPLHRRAFEERESLENVAALRIPQILRRNQPLHNELQGKLCRRLCHFKRGAILPLGHDCARLFLDDAQTFELAEKILAVPSDAAL